MPSRRAALTGVTLLPLSAAVATAPASAQAATVPTAPAAAAPGASVTRSIRLTHRRLHLRVGRSIVVSGRVAGAAAGSAVRLQVRRPGRWVTVDRARTRPSGRFRVHDRRRATMSARVRVAAPAQRGQRRTVEAVGRVNVYRTAHASWYGPGLYGNHLGCGGTLGTGTLGVANKSLPCGTKVSLRNGHRTVRVRVIDRGPYVGGREYDLTAATAQRLGFHGHGALQVTR